MGLSLMCRIRWPSGGLRIGSGCPLCFHFLLCEFRARRSSLDAGILILSFSVSKISIQGREWYVSMIYKLPTLWQSVTAGQTDEHIFSFFFYNSKTYFKDLSTHLFERLSESDKRKETENRKRVREWEKKRDPLSTCSFHQMPAAGIGLDQSQQPSVSPTQGPSTWVITCWLWSALVGIWIES